MGSGIALRTRFALDTLFALNTLWTGLTLRAFWASVALRTLWPGRPLRARWTRFALWALLPYRQVFYRRCVKPRSALKRFKRRLYRPASCV